MVSEYVWLAIWIVGFIWEMVGVFTYKRTGIEPLTTIVRDRLMKRHRSIWVAVLAFWVWLGGHFFLGWGP